VQAFVCALDTRLKVAYYVHSGAEAAWRLRACAHRERVEAWLHTRALAGRGPVHLRTVLGTRSARVQLVAGPALARRVPGLLHPGPVAI